MNDFLSELDTEFRNNANPVVAAGQKAYMKNQFEFYGVKTPVRRKIQKQFFHREVLPLKKDLEPIVKALWDKPQRENQYFAQELTEKYTKQFEVQDIDLLEYMITHKSWWDTIDFIAPKLVGEYFKLFPKQRNKVVEKWLTSNNIWLQRSAILFQLKYKDKIDTDFLVEIIKYLQGSKEFFINKAIGWILREYSKINPQWVLDFVKNNTLDKLSQKEAIRLLDNSI